MSLTHTEPIPRPASLSEPRTVEQRQQEATALLLGGRAAEASRVLTDALAQSQSADLWNHWGVAELLLAERGFRRALEMDPSHPKAALNLGCVLFTLGRAEEARSLFERSLPGLSGPAQTHVLTLLALCVRQINPSGAAVDHESLKKQVRRILDEYFEKGNRSNEIIAPASAISKVDSDPKSVEKFFRTGHVHDQDYLVFGAFRDPETTILDVGAHYGYSATSIWSSGAASHVISFEANQLFEPCLRHVARLRPGRYDYRLVALGESTGALAFAMPVVNGGGMGALTTACPSPDLNSLANNIVKYFQGSFPGRPIASFQIHRFESPMARLDDVLAAGGFAVPTKKIVAIKVDTEGYEAETLAGCPDLLAMQKPLVLAEGGHSNPAIYRQLQPFGYVYAVRNGRQLEIVNQPRRAVNGFLLHPDHADEYRHIGLLGS